MALEIPSKFEFEHLLSHTFPGFFSALSLFILIDVWSSKDITSLVTSDLTNFGLFIGFIVFIGSILGIIIDGIHHSLVEDSLFDHMIGLNEIKDKIAAQCFLEVDIMDDVANSKLLTRHFFLNDKVSEFSLIHSNLIKNVYCYSEFYSNTFLALILFSAVIPNYLVNTIELSNNSSVVISAALYIFAWISLYSGYVAYKRYTQGLYSAIYSLVRRKETDTINSNNSYSTKNSDTIKKPIDATNTFDETITIENKSTKTKTAYLNKKWADWTKKNPAQLFSGETDFRLECVIIIFIIMPFMLNHFIWYPLYAAPTEDQNMNLSLDPSSIVVNLTEGEEYVEQVSIKNIGINLTDINVDKIMYPDSNDKWLTIDDIQNKPLNQGDIGFFQVNLNANSVGTYRGFIEIEGIIDDGIINGDGKNGESQKIMISILMKVEPAEREDIELNVNYKSSI